MTPPRRDAQLLDKYFTDKESYAKAVCLKLLRADRAAMRRVVRKYKQECMDLCDTDYVRGKRDACDDLLAALRGRP